jgi:hypothetical protein
MMWQLRTPFLEVYGEMITPVWRILSSENEGERDYILNYIEILIEIVVVFFACLLA